MVTVSRASSGVLGLIPNPSERLACAPKVCLDVGLLLAGAELWEVATGVQGQAAYQEQSDWTATDLPGLDFLKKGPSFPSRVWTWTWTAPVDKAQP